MPQPLMRLRHVPDDEADEVRALLESEGIAFHETRPDRWGFSAGAIWVSDPSQQERASMALQRYQQERSARARAEWDTARRDGRAGSVWQEFRREPVRVIVIVLAIFGVLALMALPVLMLGR